MKAFIQAKCFFMQRCGSCLLTWHSVIVWFFERVSDIELPMHHRAFYGRPRLLTPGQYLNKSRVNDQLKSQSLIGPLKTMKTAFSEYRQTALSRQKKVLSKQESSLSKQKTALSKQKKVSNKDKIALMNSQAAIDDTASINQIAAGIAHEINNPLGFISSNLNTLQEYTESLKAKIIQQQRLIERYSAQEAPSKNELMALHHDAEINYILGDVDGLISESIAGVARVKSIIEDISEIPHVGFFDAKHENINKIVDFTLSQISVSAEKNIRFIKEYDDLLATKVSVSNLNRALLALVNNAAQAVEANGKIIMRTTQLQRHVRIDVIDNGCGIAEDKLTAIFNPFYTTQNIGDGAGLGLYMAKNIAESHGGALSVSSKEGQGTVLTMILPISDCNADASNSPVGRPLSL